jgi:alkylation response protein AidB-like acyl-CoA dehydrogenase
MKVGEASSMTYKAPLAEQSFVLETIGDLPGLARFSKFSALDDGIAGAILEEGSRLAEGVFAPLNQRGDTEGLAWSSQGVKHPEGFADAYTSYIEGGWGSLSAEPEYGGQGLPFTLALAFAEQLTASNMAFSLCMLLTGGAVEAIHAHGADEQKRLYLPKLISGQWTGTMNLTEPQAGSDVGALRAAATPAADGSWRIKGSKIFITWGEHDLAENIVHLVLARTPGAPAGTRGISLFLVPKFLPDAAGNPGGRNDLRCVSIEHKLGIHASPTCAMTFGDEGQCVGWLIGAENAGMRAMFTMMNAARISVGLQGVAISERAYQGALAYARDRVQSVPIGGVAPARIIEHPDVRRMLMTMRATTQAIRAIAYFNAAAIDRSRVETDGTLKHAARGLADLLTPITKAYATDQGVEMASLAIQVFGGMGFIEETGAAQHYRDIRIAPIYEGTNGIQALDLVGRKLHADGGAHWRRLIDELSTMAALLPRKRELGNIRVSVIKSLKMLREATEKVVSLDATAAAWVASPFLKMFGIILGASLLAKQAGVAATKLAKDEGDVKFLGAKIATAAFFTQELLPQAQALYVTTLRSSSARSYTLSNEQFAS